MPGANIVREINVIRTPRVMQVEGIFEVPPSTRSREKWHVEFDLPDEWNIGVVVGPSGSGKTTIINELWKDAIVDEWDWDEQTSVLDSFPADMSVKDIVNLLSSVGFSSPHSWVRPFRVLSNGEQFRVNIARTLAEKPDLAVVDEFTSVVDRTVAKIGSAAIQKTVRRRGQKFIVSSCHYDVIDWLEPDWVYKPDTGEYYTGRYLHQRPKIEVEIKRVHYSAWEIFRRHHYLDTSLNKAAICFVGFIDDAPVTFLGVLYFPHPIRPGWRYHRLVCLPDYQGVGLGTKMADYIGSVFKATGSDVFRNLSHPAVIHACKKSPDWKMIRNASRVALSVGPKGMKAFNKTLSSRRLTASFEYVGEPAPKEVAEGLLMKKLD